MRLSLAQFIEKAKKSRMPSISEYVSHPGFSSFYVRYGDCFVDGERLHHVLTIASIEAKKPGKGTFTNFVNRQHRNGQDVYVECVQNPRFRVWLEYHGFKQVNIGNSANHYFRKGWKQDGT
jgi:hypothetical protein